MSLNEHIIKYRRGEFSLANRVEDLLHKAEKSGQLNAYLRLFPEAARERARQLDQKIAGGEPVGRLAGCLLAVKDNINMKGQETTCGSKILQGFRAPFDATVIEKLKAEDAILLGKTNMDEFAMGSSTENSAFGVVRNPADPSRVPGGSSGGSAVAVAAGLADAALGSETGGSIRQPASFTGTVGIKPSYGRVSRYGLVAYASSFDQIGTFGNTVEDAALLLQVIAGYDEHDSTSVKVDVPDYASFTGKGVKGLKVGLPDEFFGEGLDQEIKDGIFELKELLLRHGAEVQPVRLPMTEYAIATYYILAMAEASSNLARYDGVRYGLRARDAENLVDMYAATRSAGFGEEVRRRILLGTYVLSSGYYDAYYRKAQQVRRLIKEELDRAFAAVDILLTPTTPTTAFAIGEKTDDPLTMYLSDIYTVTANLAGICAISLPAGMHSNGLPYGVQLMAGRFREEQLVRVGDFIEKQRVTSS